MMGSVKILHSIIRPDILTYPPVISEFVLVHLVAHPPKFRIGRFGCFWFETFRYHAVDQVADLVAGLA